mgnify:CR=1 FL=1
MRHVFRATKMGWSKEQEGVWFDSFSYTKDEPRLNSNHTRGQQWKAIPIRDMSTMGRSIMM